MTHKRYQHLVGRILKLQIDHTGEIVEITNYWVRLKNIKGVSVGISVFTYHRPTIDKAILLPK